MKAPEAIDERLAEDGFDGFLMRGDASDANMLYLTGFEAPDPVVYLRVDTKDVLLVSPLEVSRAEEEADVDEVISTAEFKDGDTRENVEAEMEIFEPFLERYGIDDLAVPGGFPLHLADNLRDRDFTVEPVEDFLLDSRIQKTEAELENIEEAQDITEQAVKRAEEMLEDSEEGKDGVLVLEGEPLTSERMKRAIKNFLLDHGCSVPEETIVASGNDSAKPHSTGSGPIRAGEPVIIDVFPRHDSRYFGDMTRTLVKGEADEDVKKMHRAVREAQKEALEVLEEGEGVTTTEVYETVCDVLEEHGFKTLRDGDIDSGFLHSAGHSIGLELHEPPRIADNGRVLEAGTVLTVEPGLYVPGVGGVRVEDMIVITEDGCENYNSMHKRLELAQ